MKVKMLDVKLAKCESCGGDVVYHEWPAGWSQTGGSKYGEKYDKDGIAWWCPQCKDLKEDK